jgi:DNA polymerase III delta prime subunit
MNWGHLLFEKASKKQLGHFYILETSLSPDVAYEKLLEFVTQFIKDYFQKIDHLKQNSSNLLDYPDVFMMGNLPEYQDKKDPNYVVSDAEAMIRYFEFRPVQGSRKFAVIPEGHKLTNQVANKCLKLLEEPNGNSTIFLLNPRGQKLLDTIQSRGLTLRISFQKEKTANSNWTSFIQKSATQNLADFIESNQKTDFDVAYWTQEWATWEAEHPEDINAKQAVIDWLKNLQELETFHQPSATKWTLFYGVLKLYVFNRLSR